MVPHSVKEILNRVQTKHLSAARLTKYEVALLTPSNLTIQRCSVLNPATLLPQHITSELSDHNCMELVTSETAGLLHVTDVPLQNPDLILFVDGSRFHTDDGKPHTGYAVVSLSEVIFQEALPPTMSAQEADLCAPKKACEYAVDRTANIYTDSRYAFGVAHDYGPI